VPYQYKEFSNGTLEWGMDSPKPLPAFLRGNVPGCSSLISAWLRGLESADELVARWTADLPDEGFWWSPAEGTNSIGALLVHASYAARRLATFARGLPLPRELDRPATERFATGGETPAAVLEQFRAAMAETRAAMQALQPDDLETLRERLGQRVPALHLWHKIVEHTHEHVGQVITLRKLWNAENERLPAA